MELYLRLPQIQNPAIVHYVMETLAFVVGLWWYRRLRREQRDFLSDEQRWLLLVAMILGAFVGSRLIAVLENPAQIGQLGWLDWFQSKTVAGGFVGGLLGVELMKKKIGIHTATGDIYVEPILIALCIGRVGCLLSGLHEPTFGTPTSFFLAVYMGDGIPRHPVVLYEILFLLALLVFFRKTTLTTTGDRFKMFMVLYFLFRFCVEFLKPYRPLALHLSSIHWTAVFVLAYYHRFLSRRLKNTNT